ncbi:MAG: DUF4358 domain-containing protein [Anaerotruncus sp.]|nr:DUF4358 domain-containing protein [Anaerotruncus sp.]
MKKLIAICLTALICTGAFMGCGKKADSESAQEMKPGNTVQTVVDKIEAEVGIAMAENVDDTLLKDIFSVNPEDVEEYAGKFSMAMVNADNVVAIKAKPEKVQNVVDGLTQRLEALREQFETYLPDQKEKLAKGKVLQKGNYVFLLVVGYETESFDADIAKAEEIVEAAF